MRGGAGRCGASRVLASLPETGCLLLSGQARLPGGLQLPKKCIAPQRGLHPRAAGPQDLLGVGRGPRIPPTTLATRPVQRPSPPPPRAPARVLGGPRGGRRGTPGPGGRRRSGASRPPHPRACSLPFGLWPQPASVETVAGRAPVARPRGCFTSVSSLRVSSRHPSGPPRSPVPAR